MRFSLTGVFTTLIISIIYAMFLYTIKQKKIPFVTNDQSEVAKRETGTPETTEAGTIQHVASTMKSKVTVIPVLTEQLKAVISQTDTAAEGLIAAFFGINRQSKKQLQSVNELFGNLSEEAGGNSLSETQQKLQELQSNFSAMTSFLDKSIEMIENVVTQLSRVDEFASKIKKIGQMTNILAINASIEAAHSGSAGNGFKVIASEINTLAKDSTESVKEITNTTENLTSNIVSIKEELETVHKDTMEIGKRTDDLFGFVLKKIGETLQNATEKVRMIAGDAEELNKEVGKVVVSIQFQDITRQRLEHVISPLESLQNDVNNVIQVIEHEGNVSLQTPLNSSENDLMQQYTMESEREILRALQNNQS